MGLQLAQDELKPQSVLFLHFLACLSSYSVFLDLFWKNPLDFLEIDLKKTKPAEFTPQAPRFSERASKTLFSTSFTCASRSMKCIF